MNEIDIEKLITAEQRRRQSADRAHLQWLADAQRGDLKRWSTQRRRVARSVALVLLVAIPTTYAMILPQRGASPVLCNLRGDKLLVIDRACSPLGNCSNRPVADWMHTVGVN